MTKQAENTQKNQATNEAKEVNLATASVCAEGMLDFVRNEGVKLAIRLVPDIKEGQENAIGLHVENNLFPVENDAFANKLGSNLHDLLEDVIQEIMPKVIGLTMAQMAEELGEECDCSGCRLRREMEKNSDSAEPTESGEPSQSTESATDSI
ncbi:TPA: hypothetical protein KDY90_002549 [Vibrio parahaemolyticus]|nr:hypothetical protein [Vibrio parahaemolyticus]